MGDVVIRGQSDDVVYGLPHAENAQRRVITASILGVRVINVYCTNGATTDSPKFAYKRKWFAALNASIHTRIQQYAHVVLPDDFNIAHAHNDVDDAVKWRGKILCSEDKRLWFQQ